MRANCQQDRFAQWKLLGFTNAAYKIYWDALQEHLLNDMKVNMAVHGLSPKEVFEERVSKAEAQREIDDPLIDFPEDISYDDIKDEQIAVRAQEYQRFLQRWGDRQLTAEQEAYFWTPERVNAFKGNDAIARRCSVNGHLWMLYKHLCKEYAGKVEPETIKKLLRREILFSKLYPSTQDIARYRKTNTAVDAQIDARTGKTSEVHLKMLAEAGLLKRILKEFSGNGTIVFPKELTT